MTNDDGISRRQMLFGGGRRTERRDPSDDTSGERREPAATPVAGATPLAHRPPGAVAEPAFLAGCTRCGDCIDVCPVDAIGLAGPRYGPAAGTPMIDPMKSPCIMCEDTPCITACEPGVLSNVEPLRMGLASVRADSCLAHRGTFCTVCSERCPVEDAIRVERGRPIIVEDHCTGCGVCQHVCPAPYNAILILPRAEPGEPGAIPTPEPSPETTDEAGGAFDWRAAYFGDRGLRPPEHDPERPEGN